MQAGGNNLLARARNGDLSAYRRIVERYRAPIVAVGLAHLLSRDDALRVAADVCATAFDLLADCPDDDAFGRLVFDHARNTSACYAIDGAWQGPKLAELVRSGAVTRRQGTGVVIRGDLATAITALLEAVPVAARLSLALRTYAGLSYEEIARLQDLAVADVSAHLAHAMASLSEQVTADVVRIAPPVEGLG